MKIAAATERKRKVEEEDGAGAAAMLWENMNDEILYEITISIRHFVHYFWIKFTPFSSIQSVRIANKYNSDGNKVSNMFVSSWAV